MLSAVRIPLMALAACALALWSPARADEKAERQSDALAVQNMLGQRDFKGLEAMAATERDTMRLGASGIWRLQHFYSYVNGYFGAIQKQGDCQAPVAIGSRWLEAYPHSPTAIIAKAQALSAAAFCFRGTAYANQVTAEGWRKFFDYESQARELLTTRRAEADRDPQWFAQMEARALSSSTDPKDFMALVEEGTKRFPLYNGLYDEGVIFFAPRWSGSKEATESFIRWAAERTKGVLGDDLYARLYWYQADMLHLRNLRQETDIDWERMKRSMEGLAEHYPDTWNLQNLARLACQSGDIAEGVKLLNRIQPKVDVAGWEGVAKDGICDRDLLA